MQNLEPHESDLFDGLSGVVFFLAYLGDCARPRNATPRLCAPRLVHVAAADRLLIVRPMNSIGGYRGGGGVLYSLAHLAELWQEPELHAQALNVIERLHPLIERDESLDVIQGSAGCIGGGFVRDGSWGEISSRALELAVRCGNRLLARGSNRKRTASAGRLNQASSRRSPGFSHGAAGFAWALLKLARETGDQRYGAAAREGSLAYERSQFLPEVKNWRDLRDALKTDSAAKQQPEWATFWCNGAPGIGMSRLLSLPHLDDTAIRGEIDTALETTLAHGFVGYHSLCHGDVGNLELFLQAEAVLGEPRWRIEANRLGGNILADIAQRGWRYAEVERPRPDDRPGRHRLWPAPLGRSGTHTGSAGSGAAPRAAQRLGSHSNAITLSPIV